jgi:uncharacterized protein YjbJ (UPF0337 family)
LSPQQYRCGDKQRERPEEGDALRDHRAASEIDHAGSSRRDRRRHNVRTIAAVPQEQGAEPPCNPSVGPEFNLGDKGATMNWDRIEGNWEQFKGKIQQQWGELTDDDLDRVEGRQKELAGRIQERYGKTQEDAEREVNEWLARN